MRGWPTIYVLDAKGVIRYKGLRGDELDKAVDELLKEMDGKGEEEEAVDQVEKRLTANRRRADARA